MLQLGVSQFDFGRFISLGSMPEVRGDDGGVVLLNFNFYMGFESSIPVHNYIGRVEVSSSGEILDLSVLLAAERPQGVSFLSCAGRWEIKCGERSCIRLFLCIEVTNFVSRATYCGRLMMGQKEDELPEGSPP